MIQSLLSARGERDERGGKETLPVDSIGDVATGTRLFKPLISALAFVMMTVLSERAQAIAPVMDIDIFYFSDAFAYSGSTNSYTRMIWDVMIGLPLAAKGRWVIGWNYDSYALNDKTAATTTTLAITDMGPKLEYYIDRDRSWVVALAYGLINKGTYSSGSGGSSEVLQGSSLRGEFGYVPQMSESVSIGAKLNYYRANFTEQISNQTTITKVTDGRTLIYPSFTMTVRFD